MADRVRPGFALSIPAGYRTLQDRVTCDLRVVTRDGKLLKNRAEGGDHSITRLLAGNHTWRECLPGSAARSPAGTFTGGHTP
jgi:hypothetical protein